ncbi:MAG: hypothetical protein MK101_08385 [Phycisphaerales bacterium]|nr:hypothetical protein [Phycisphaerales bacterium]
MHAHQIRREQGLIREIKAQGSTGAAEAAPSPAMADTCRSTLHLNDRTLAGLNACLTPLEASKLELRMFRVRAGGLSRSLGRHRDIRIRLLEHPRAADVAGLLSLVDVHFAYIPRAEAEFLKASDGRWSRIMAGYPSDNTERDAIGAMAETVRLQRSDALEALLVESKDQELDTTLIDDLLDSHRRRE